MALFFTLMDNRTITLGTVTDSDESLDRFSVQTLCSTDEKKLTYEFSDDTDEVYLQDILCLVNPYFQKKGTIVKLLARDLKAGQVKLREHNQNM